VPLLQGKILDRQKKTNYFLIGLSAQKLPFHAKKTPQNFYQKLLKFRGSSLVNDF